MLNKNMSLISPTKLSMFYKFLYPLNFLVKLFSLSTLDCFVA